MDSCTALHPVLFPLPRLQQTLQTRPYKTNIAFFPDRAWPTWEWGWDQPS